MHLSVSFCNCTLYLFVLINSRDSRPAHKIEVMQARRTRTRHSTVRGKQKKKLHLVNCLHNSTIVCCFSCKRYFIIGPQRRCCQNFFRKCCDYGHSYRLCATRTHTHTVLHHAGEILLSSFKCWTERKKNITK